MQVIGGGIAILTLAVAAAAPAGAAAAEPVDVHRTQHGVVHIEADSEFALAYGLAHEYASDNVCLLADFMISVSGERSRYFGPEARTVVGFEDSDNLTSDLYFRYYISDAAFRQTYTDLGGPARDLIRGFVAGYNAYLDEQGRAELPAACRNAEWVRPMTEVDMFRMIEERAVLSGGTTLFQAIVGASPPGVPAAVTREERPEPRRKAFGSNGWAFGSDVTENGGGLLFANPHFPWETINRFYQVHLRLRGEFDVMGMMLPPLPMVLIGFNRDVAWTHTWSTAHRFTLFELELAPDDPRAYLIDGVRHPMSARSVRVAAREPDGGLRTYTHTFYETVHGPIVSLPGFEWGTERAYALADVNRGNTDTIATWLGIARAKNVEDVRAAAAATRGIFWLNTIAADSQGATLFADLSRVPIVTKALAENCRPSAEGAAAAAESGLFVLDGSRGSCRWDAAADPWLPASELPVVMRRDYVANHNDSYWLVNANATQPALSPILGPAAVPQGLRTRVGLDEIESRLGNGAEESDRRIRAKDVQAILYSNRNYSGDLFADDVLALCEDDSEAALPNGQRIDITDACSAVAGWDRRNELDSRGTALFREFWVRARRIEGVYAVPFDPADPVRTPRGLNLDDSRVRAALRTALAEAAELLRRNGFAPDVRLGDIQAVVRNGRRIGIHGGGSFEGVLNQHWIHPLGPQGYVPYDGTSYVQIVQLGAGGPVARGLLTYSQSVDPASPWYTDQTELYVKELLYRLPFTNEEIRSDPAHRHERLIVPRPEAIDAP